MRDNIVNRMSLLGDIIHQLQDRNIQCYKVWNLQVKLYDSNEEICTMSLPCALDFLYNDIYFNENHNWSNATYAKVESY